MANITPLQDVFDRHKYDLATAAKKSRGWFERQVALLTKERLVPQKIIRGNVEQITVRVRPGFLYLYGYDPKMKDTLPYYDRFPLVFPYRKTEDGFIGLNLHYLPYHFRIQLLDRLLVFRNNTRMDETTRLKYSWALIDGVSRYAAAQPCIKQYLMSHVKTQFRQINADDWATAMMLPVEGFVNATKQQVWADSKRKMRR